MSVIINGIRYVPQQERKEIPPTFGDLMRNARKALKYSLDAAAEAIGCSKSYLWEIENGRCEPSLRIATLISDTYGVSLEEMAESLFAS